MEGSNCGGEGGWTRVVFVNMTNPGATCPQGLAQKNYSGQLLCGRNIARGCQSTTFPTFNLNHCQVCGQLVNMTNPGATCPQGLAQKNYSGQLLCGRNIARGCQSTTFPTFNLNHCQVCGQLRGYQFGTPEAFVQSIIMSSLTVDSQYLDGVSITHSSVPRQHIWTYAVGVTTDHTNRFGCPCNTGSTVSPPSIVGSDYYCESATSSSQSGVFFPNDVMWDGQQCTGSEGPCCSDNPNLPWFNTTLYL